MPKTVISDLGNCLFLVDFEKALDKFLKHSKSNYDKRRMSDFINDFYRREYETGKVDTYKFRRTLVQELKLKMKYDEFFEAWNGIFSVNKPYLKTLEALKSGKCRLLYLSNNNEAHAKFLKEEHKKEMAMFEGGIFSQEVNLRKPQKEIYELTLKRFSLKPKDCVFIDDKTENVLAARNCGIPSVQYDFQNHIELEERLKKIKIL